MRELNFEIMKNTRIAHKTYEMKLSCEGSDHGISNPGQFVNVKLDGFFLRRPISVCDWDDKGMTLIYKVVGAGTEAMSGLDEGDTLSILTPLGNGFDISCRENIGERPLLIGGGVGVPPMYGLCKRFIAAGKMPTALLGFNSSKDSFYVENFKETGADVVVTTADGSMGEKGFVTDVLERLEYTYFFACGPEAMLRAVTGAADGKIDGQLSFEERMGCGFGACMGCSCETKYGYKRICKEGPVLKRGEIIW